jgi:hypothetical protein
MSSRTSGVCVLQVEDYWSRTNVICMSVGLFIITDGLWQYMCMCVQWSSAVVFYVLQLYGSPTFKTARSEV